MEKPFGKKYIFLILLVAFLTAGVTLLLVNIFEKKKEATLYPSVLKPVGEYDTDAKVWGDNFPFEYDTYKKTEVTDTPTYYGGSKSYSKLRKYPVLVELFAGYPFSEDYNEERGHFWAITDVKQTLRINEKTPNTCITCKSPQTLVDIEKMGPENFYKAMFKDLGAHYDKSISCLDCHDAKTMELRVRRPAFIEIEKMGPENFYKAMFKDLGAHYDKSISCLDCHDAKTMELRVRRPAFIE